MELKNSETAKNLMTAFDGESQARNRYTYFASQARKEGFVQIADIFEETANQEREHAKRLFKLMTGGEQAITAAFPAGVIGSTSENLLTGAIGEHYEYAVMYPEFAETAREEGFEEVAQAFLAIAVAERQHEKRYLALSENVVKGRVFRREEAVTWHCRNCGFLHEDEEAPVLCPACVHPQAHFELLAENW